MELIDGKKVSAALKAEIAEEVARLRGEGKPEPHLAVILVGDDGGSQTYVANKVRSCHEVGFRSTKVEYPADVPQETLLAKIDELNADPGVHGLLVQLPLPRHIDEQAVLERIAPAKDVDGFHPVNMGKLVAGIPTLLPATPAGIVELLERYKIETRGKHCVVLGRSHIVGTPAALLLSRKAAAGDATVTICHSRTPDIARHTRQADIIVAAIGVPGFLKGDMVKEGAVVIDVGTSRVADPEAKNGWRLRGDVDFDSVAPKCSYITPVPGGVGPMTIAILLKNTLKAYQAQN